jgi:5-methylcytosine-specific restriction endonuclease McrA
LEIRKNPERDKELKRVRAAKQRIEFKLLLGGRCVKCGSSERLEFDHIDPSEKSFTIGKLFGRKRIETLKEEVSKCQLLCKPCHIKKHR